MAKFFWSHNSSLVLVSVYIRFARLAFFLATISPWFIRLAHLQLKALRTGESIPLFDGGLWLGGLAVIALNAVVAILSVRWNPRLSRDAEAQASWLDHLSFQYIAPGIALAAGVGLFLQLTVIRWQVSTIPLLAFYKNFGLLSCFAGLGIGYALARNKQIPLSAVIPLILVQVAVQSYLKFAMGADLLADVIANPVVETLNMGIINVRTRLQFSVVYLTLAGFFILTVLAFVPLGQLAGRLMQRAETNLRAYSWNLLGSLGGVLLMLVMSMLWTPPVVWFAISFAMILPFVGTERRAQIWSALFSLAVLGLIAWPGELEVQRLYSPYQLIEREYTTEGLMHIRAGGHTFQTAHNFSESYLKREGTPDQIRLARYYELPYLSARNIDRVGVVGSGTGNDVAAALRMGAEHVDAIEIDPAILELGRLYHPERPYLDERVTSIVNDARTHFRNIDATYDLIVYGLLDSHTVLSHSSSVRLDSFVYTVQGLREARARLEEDGVLSLSFFVLTPELGSKISKMMSEAFDGHPPVVLRSTYNKYYLFLQAKNGNLVLDPGIVANAEYEHFHPEVLVPLDEVDVATDDWPFFYMVRRVFPFSYFALLGMFLGLTGLMLAGFFRERLGFSHAIFFFLGAGFMLVETKGITELGLTFGNTWQVIGIVICGVLTMAYFANVIVERMNIEGLVLPFALLLASIAVGYWVASGGGLSSTFFGRIGTVFFLTWPIFFSGICFSTALRRTDNVAGAMAANMMGAMVGGMLEYSAMKFGYQALYILAIALYLAAGLSYCLRRSV